MRLKLSELSISDLHPYCDNVILHFCISKASFDNSLTLDALISLLLTIFSINDLATKCDLPYRENNISLALRYPFLALKVHSPQLRILPHLFGKVNPSCRADASFSKALSISPVCCEVSVMRTLFVLSGIDEACILKSSMTRTSWLPSPGV